MCSNHGMSSIQTAPSPAPDPTVPARCVIVVDETLPPGLAANAAAMLALTLGAGIPGLVGAGLVDADGDAHPGFIPAGLPILRAPGDALAELRSRALAADVGVIAFPAFGQQTTDYDEVIAHVAQTPTAELRYRGLAFHGPARAVRKLTGNLALLR
jgi:hypothetical protein